jgi:probable phosphoglycerate mutase
VCALYLVRHGESEWNVRRLTQGQTAHPRLTDRGRGQAEAAARAVADDAAVRGVRLTRLLTSDLVRAVETADIVGCRIGVAAEPEPRLREQQLGTLEGRGYDETWAAAAQHDWSDPTARISGGESVAELHGRLAAVVDEAAEGSVLVSHGDAIRAALGRRAGHVLGQEPWVEVPNGAVFRLEPGRRWHRVWPAGHDGQGMAGSAVAW